MLPGSPGAGGARPDPVLAEEDEVKRIQMLPNLVTMGNAFCGLLALSKGIDALASGPGSPVFYEQLEMACWLIVLAAVFDALDGKIARLTKSFSDFGAQLDSFADALTFGLVPAVLVKVLLLHEMPLGGMLGHPRLHFLAAASFALMALLRLARFNLENDHSEEGHDEFRGLPTPAAAGAVISALLLYMSLFSPTTEVEHGQPTPTGALVSSLELEPLQGWFLPALMFLLPVLGLLMASRGRYAHLFSMLTRGRSHFFTLVSVVFGLFVLYGTPVLFLFVFAHGFVLWGLAAALVSRVRSRSVAERGVARE